MDASLDDVLGLIKERFRGLSPQLRQAAQFVADNPGAVGVSSLRALAADAGVKPNTLVRLAAALGFDTWEGLRRPFREVARQGVDGYPDRARRLQRLRHGGSHGLLFGRMASAAIANMEMLFQTLDPVEVRRAARLVVGAGRAWAAGVGSCYPVMLDFHYVARMAFETLQMTPRPGGTILDDILGIGSDDALIAATYHPYRRETVEAVRYARERGASIVAVTDSRASPIAIEATVAFVAPTATPQFFPSTLGLSAVLETLLAFMVAEADTDAVERIGTFHRLRSERALYWEGGA